MGSLCSLILIVVIGAYAYIKTDVMLLKKDIDIITSTHRHYFDAEYVFDYRQGLNFAFAFTGFDSEREEILDPSYGRIVFINFAWGIDENGETYEEVHEIPSH